VHALALKSGAQVLRVALSLVPKSQSPNAKYLKSNKGSSAKLTVKAKPAIEIVLLKVVAWKYRHRAQESMQAPVQKHLVDATSLTAEGELQLHKTAETRSTIKEALHMSQFRHHWISQSHGQSQINDADPPPMLQ